MKILFLVIHTKKQEDRYETILNTWGRDVDFLFYSDHEDLKKNIIKVSDNNTYSSGQEKQINIINNLPEDKLNYDWYVFVDNDSFINTFKIKDFIKTLNTNNVYGELCNCWPVNKNLYYALGGAGIFISNENLKKIKGHLTHNPVIWGDVSLGINLDRLGIKMVNSELLHSQLPKHYEIKDNEVKNHISFHYVLDYESMNNLYNLCNG
jgi:hypothetical protein